MKNIFCFLLLLGLTVQTLVAQYQLEGTITDESGPVPYVTVQLMDGSSGVLSDQNGYYKLVVSDYSQRLLISHIGYKSQELPIPRGVKTLDISLLKDHFNLEEVIVTGYNSKLRKDIGGAVSSVSGEDIKEMPIVTMETALQGRAAGVQVTKQSGAPGSGIEVRVRGTSSISSSSRPLYVVDGVPVIDENLSETWVGGAGLNSLADINPNDIASIEVLKDASTAAIYGSRGGNGVVLITTKKGQAGKTRINLKTSYGFQDLPYPVELLDTGQFYSLVEDICMNGLGIPCTDPNALGPDFKGGANQDWQDVIYRRGWTTDNALSISGGNLNTRFYTSLAYFEDQGIIENSHFKRYSGRFNLDHNAGKHLKVGFNMTFAYSSSHRIINDNHIFGAVGSALVFPPDVPIKSEDGSYETRGVFENPAATVTDYINQSLNSRTLANGFAEFSIMQGLSVKAMLGADISALRENTYMPANTRFGAASNGLAGSNNTNFLRWITEFTLNFKKEFRKHRILAIGGSGFQEDRREFAYIERTDFPTTDFTVPSAGATVALAESNFAENGLQSYFVNFDYGFDDRYLITGSLRADGYSGFSENNKFGIFPGASFAWRLSSEAFMKNISWIQDLKIRGGYGITGNNRVGNYDFLQLYTGGANYVQSPGIIPSSLGNTELKWETTAQLHAGLDFTLLQSRISGSLDYYQKNTSDLLLSRPLPSTSGFTSVTENIGKVRNTGVEVSLNTRNLTGKIKWITQLNVSYNKNEVTELYQDQPIVGFLGVSRTEVGQPVASFYGFVVDGIFQTEAEVDAAPVQSGGTAPGDLRFKDLNSDGIINDEDRTFLGSPQPDFYGGITNTFEYGGLELSLLLQGAAGVEIYNSTRVFVEGMYVPDANQSATTLDRWRQEGDQTDIPRAVWGDPNNNRRTSDRFVEDGSYLRIKTLTLAYDFPAPLLKKIFVEQLCIYITAQNLATFTEYSWYDPEVNWLDRDDTSVQAEDFFTYPQPRTTVMGINIGF